MNDFLATIEKRAYQTAYFAVRNQADALDIVQDAMMTLAQSYAHKTANDWPPLSQHIQDNDFMEDVPLLTAKENLEFYLWLEDETS